jgi:hypothetical protein
MQILLFFVVKNSAQRCDLSYYAKLHKEDAENRKEKMNI